MRLLGLSRFIANANRWRSNVSPNRNRNRARKLLLENLETRRVFAAFSPGNLLVIQSSDGTSSNAAALNLVEYSTSGALIQSIPVTSSGAGSLTLRGSSTTEGVLSLSADGQVVTFGGYRADAGSVNPSTAAVDRVIGRVGPDGLVNTSQSFSDGFIGDSFRSVATDNGSRFWLSGAGSNASTGGIRYVANTTNSTTTAVTGGGNSRQVQIINGNLYVGSGSNTSPSPGRSIFQIGTGLPTSSPQTFTNSIPILTAGPQYQSFYFTDLNPSVGWNGSVLDTLYTTDTSGSGGPVTKWTYDGASWITNGTIATGSPSGAPIGNIVGITNGTTVTLFGATTSATVSTATPPTTASVVTLADISGYNGALTGNWANLSAPVFAGEGGAFRGITRVPQVPITELSIAATDANKLEGDAGTTAFTFTVTRTGPLTATSSASWAVSGLGPNAANGTDFVGGVLPSGTVNFLVGEASKVITVNVNGDLTNETAEGFTVTLSAPVGASIATNAANGSILNDDAPTDLAISSTSANKAEGDAGPNNFTFTVTRSGVTAGMTSSATYTVSGSGANQAIASDFLNGVFPTGIVTFTPGQTSQVISIPVNGDTTVEADEGFIVTLSNPSVGTSIIGISANGVIINDDSDFVISPATLSVPEGNSGTTPMVFNVTRSGNASLASNIAWSVTPSGSTPAASNDFVGSAFPSGTVNFLANETVKTITVNVQGDTSLEGYDTFTLTLDSATTGTIIAGAATGVIVADDFQNLSTGDVVITAIASDNPDTFSFVPLVNLLPGSTIILTDNAWSESNTLLSSEGAFVYTAPAGGLSAGTKVVIEYVASPSTITFLAGSGSASVVGNFGLSQDGDSLLAYVGLPTSPNFLFGVTTWGEYLTAGTPTVNQTYLPPSLSVGSTAVGALGPTVPTIKEVNNGEYIHASGTSGTPAQIRALVANKANWMTSDLPFSLDNTHFSVTISNSSVVNRRVFYNRSTAPNFDNGSGNPSTSIDSTKSALLPSGETAFANYTNYIRGLNGLIVDINGLVSASASDFQFATWNGIDAGTFVPTAAVPTVTVFPGGGNAGSSRVKIEFPDNSIQNTWLQVKVLANANTALAAPDVFYFGNAIGDFNVGNIGTPITVRTNATDTGLVRLNQSGGIGSVDATNIYDINKDGRVNANDTGFVRLNANNAIIRYFTNAPANLAAGFRLVDNNTAAPAIIKELVSDVAIALPTQNNLFLKSQSLALALPEPAIAVGRVNLSSETIPILNSQDAAENDQALSIDHFFAEWSKE